MLLIKVWGIPTVMFSTNFAETLHSAKKLIAQGVSDLPALTIKPEHIRVVFPQEMFVIAPPTSLLVEISGSSLVNAVRSIPLFEVERAIASICTTAMYRDTPAFGIATLSA